VSACPFFFLGRNEALDGNRLNDAEYLKRLFRVAAGAARGGIHFGVIS